MTQRLITIDCLGRIHEITDMFDRCGHATRDPNIAESCVVIWEHTARHASTDDIPIYTVH